MQFPSLVSFDEMKKIEKDAFGKGVSLDTVMDEVARRIAEWIEELTTKENLSKKICIFAGKGNNGADSLATALLLTEKGYEITIILPFEQSHLCEKSKQFLSQLKNQNAHIARVEEVKRGNFSIVLDGLLGIGIAGEVTEPLKSAVEMINAMKSLIVSIDIPSGIHENWTGGTAVSADYTLYISLPKKCYFNKHAWGKVGKLVEIRTPSFEPFYTKSEDVLVEERCLSHHIHSNRNQNKYEAGYLLLVAGSKRMQGAAKLTAEAAYRSGCGIIRLFGSPVDLPEVITEPRDSKRFQEELARASCVCMGPGLGVDPETLSFIRECLKLTTSVPLILDADALVMMKELGLVPPEETILTPHYGELLKLLGKEKKENEEGIFKAARAYAKENRVILICKGSPTRIYGQDGSCYFSCEGDPAMATAGMGDVLSGVLAGLLGRGMAPLEAAITGVYLHAEASLQSLQKWGLFHLLASDSIRELGSRFLKFFQKR